MTESTKIKMENAPGCTKVQSNGSGEQTLDTNNLPHGPSVRPRHLTTPLTKDVLATLNAGDEVLISGEIFTARDAAHARLIEMLESAEGTPAHAKNAEEPAHTKTQPACQQNGTPARTLPYNLNGATIFYAGPTPPAATRPLGAVGPTTASRMDAYTPALMSAGLTACIGKGKRSEAVRQACVKNGCVYFASVGGIAALLAKCVEKSELVAWEDLGTEALRKLTVHTFPAYVCIDTRGRDLYREIEEACEQAV